MPGTSDTTRSLDLELEKYAQSLRNIAVKVRESGSKVSTSYLGNPPLFFPRPETIDGHYRVVQNSARDDNENLLREAMRLSDHIRWVKIGDRAPWLL